MKILLAITQAGRRAMGTWSLRNLKEPKYVFSLLRSYFDISLVQAAMGMHTICGKALEAKAYSSQGGARTPAG